jgi:hypothetical protein
MVTTKEKLTKMLVDNGMFDDQAKKVMEVAIPRIEALTPDYKITWDRPAEEYPDPVYAAIWLHLRGIALEWIDENIPKAWFRPMFT